MESSPASLAKPTVSPKNDTQKEYKMLTMAGSARYQVKSGERLNFITSAFPALVRLGTAGFVGDGIEGFKRPEKTLELYEFQACPFCRKVREALTLLDLDVLVYPCPKGGPIYRPRAQEMSGKEQFPFLVDPNTGTQLLESDDIITYLYNMYGDGQVPLALRLGPLTALSVSLGQLPRINRGLKYRQSRKPQKPITIWAYEASPFCMQTRERLTELEIPHLIKNCARNSLKRQEITEKWDVAQFPYIEDPNTMICSFETPDINQYLEDTYAL